MRSGYLVVMFFLFSQQIFAQKNDYLWALGYESGVSQYRFFLNFNEDPIGIVLRTDSISTGVFTSSYCDDNGDILFFSNGLGLFNKQGAMVENGAGLNPTIPEWQNQLSYPGWQSGFFLSKPDDSSILYFISLDFGPHPTPDWPYIITGQNLLVATIDLNANNGTGKVIEKNKVLLSGTLMAPAACRHANGRDWWILVSDADNNRHFRILLNPMGFSTPQMQEIGSKPNCLGIGNNIVGNCFSPKGNFYVDNNDYLGFSIFNFDRCSGQLSDEKRFDYPPLPPFAQLHSQNAPGTGAVFSDDERLFYKTTRQTPSYFAITVGTLPYLFQFDLSSPNFSLSIDTINIIDSSVWSFPTNITYGGFYGAELAPDGRIYISQNDSSYATVQYPNVRGKGCKLLHDNPYFGVFKGVNIPYMPNYRLGPLDGSACDTLGLNNIPVANFRMDDSLNSMSRYFYDLSHHEPAGWHWDFGDGQSSTEQNPLHTYDSVGVYPVCLTVSNQYGSNTFCRTLYLGVSATTTPKPPLPIVVAPNPFQDYLLFSLPPDSASSTLYLVDLTGSVVKQLRLNPGKNKLDCAQLPAGIYFWRVQDVSGRMCTGKVLKME